MVVNGTHVWKRMFYSISLTPTSSTSILSSPTGPRELLTILAIELAARTRNLKNYFKFQYTPANVIIIKVKCGSKILPFWVRTELPVVRFPGRDRLENILSNFVEDYC